MGMRISRYPSLTGTRVSAVEDLTWDRVVTLLSTFTVTPDKLSVPGFGAHVLRGSHRAATAVDVVTAFVFDVDAGTPEDIGVMEARLREANQAAHVYSSHSNTPANPALRLIIPPTRDIQPHEYKAIRLHLIERYAIPCKPEQSSDVSRFWFLPSHPPGRTPLFETYPGNPFDVDDLTIPKVATRRSFVTQTTPRGPFVPPPEPPPQAPVDLAPLRKKLEERVERCVRSTDRKELGAALKRLLEGAALAESGARNETTMRVCGAMVYALPRDTPLSVLLLIIRPSLNAMVADGSKLNEDKVTRMLLTAMEKRETNTVRVADFKASQLTTLDRIQTAINAASKDSKNE